MNPPETLHLTIFHTCRPEAPNDLDADGVAAECGAVRRLVHAEAPVELEVQGLYLDARE